jgi:hypothetical protein
MILPAQWISCSHLANEIEAGEATTPTLSSPIGPADAWRLLPSGNAPIG